MKLSKDLKADLAHYLKDCLSHRAKVARIVSACELTKDQIAHIQSHVPVLAHAQVEVVVDPRVLAGVVIEYGSTRIDYSVRGALDSIFARIATH